MSKIEQVVRALRERPLSRLTPAERRQEIQIALMEVEGLDPDDPYVLKAVERRLQSGATPTVLAAVKELTDLSDAELADLVGKSRSTVQAYISGRLREILDPEAYGRLALVVGEKQEEIAALSTELRLSWRQG